MAKQILLPHGEKMKLMKLFKVSRPTVRAALRFECDSDISKRIRYVATSQCGGIEVHD